MQKIHLTVKALLLTIFGTSAKDTTACCWNSAGIFRLFSGGESNYYHGPCQRGPWEFSELYSKVGGGGGWGEILRPTVTLAAALPT